MSTHKVLQLAEKFAGKTTITPAPGGINLQFQKQRAMLSGFYDHLYPELRRTISKMESELGTLHQRGFDKKMFKVMVEVYQKLIALSKSIKEDKPYVGAAELISFALSRHTKSVIENLDFMANHHLKLTNVDFKSTQFMAHPKVTSFKQLIMLAEWAQQFMDANPLLAIPSSFPPAMPVGPVPAVTSPEQKASQEEATNPAIPLAKKRDEVGQ